MRRNCAALSEDLQEQAQTAVLELCKWKVYQLSGYLAISSCIVIPRFTPPYINLKWRNTPLQLLFSKTSDEAASFARYGPEFFSAFRGFAGLQAPIGAVSFKRSPIRAVRFHRKSCVHLQSG